MDLSTLCFAQTGGVTWSRLGSLAYHHSGGNWESNIWRILGGKTMNLNYEDFREKVRDEIKDHMSEQYKDCDVMIKESMKTNREVEGLILQNIPGLENVSPTIYINDLYEEYERTGDFEAVIDKAARTMETGITSFDAKFVKGVIDTRGMIDNVFFSLINAEQNKEMLEKVPHRKFEDLAIVYRWQVGRDSDGLYTNLITNELAEREGLTEEELFNAAKENTKEMFPVTVKNMNEVITSMIFGEDELSEEMSREFEDMMSEVADERCMYVISNKANMFGAASMLYEEHLYELSEKLGSDLYILPSSVHEVIAISTKFGSPEELADMVYEINMDQVDINDRLSNQVYSYDKDLRTLRLATDTVHKSLSNPDVGMLSNDERARA